MILVFLKKVMFNKTTFEIITLIIVIIFLLLLFKHLTKLYNDRDDYKSMYESSLKENKVWKDETNHWRNRSENIEITKENLDQLKDLQNLSKEFEGVKKNLKNLENYIEVSSTTNIHKTVKIKDTTIYINNIAHKEQYFDYKDKYDTITCIIDSGKATFDIKSSTSLEEVQYWDRKWFLGKKKYFTEIKSLNPNTKIIRQKDIKVKRKKGLFN